MNIWGSRWTSEWTPGVQKWRPGGAQSGLEWGMPLQMDNHLAACKLQHTSKRGLPPQIRVATNEGPRFCENVDVALLKRTGNALMIRIDSGGTLRLNGLPLSKLDETLESGTEPS